VRAAIGRLVLAHSGGNARRPGSRPRIGDSGSRERLPLLLRLIGPGRRHQILSAGWACRTGGRLEPRDRRQRPPAALPPAPQRYFARPHGPATRHTSRRSASSDNRGRMHRMEAGDRITWFAGSRENEATTFRLSGVPPVSSRHAREEPAGLPESVESLDTSARMSLATKSGRNSWASDLEPTEALLLDPPVLPDASPPGTARC